MNAKKWVLAKYFDGMPKESDMKLVEEELPPVKNGEVLIVAKYLSVDPYMRMHANPSFTKLGEMMIGAQVGVVMDSKAAGFIQGQEVFGYFGWRTHTVYDPSKELKKGFPGPYLVPDFHGLPSSLALGVLGMPGNTAYFGVREILKPKSGETCAVTGAAGAVGSTAGQIAKLLGCHVIGLTSSIPQVSFITKDLGFDVGISYNSPDLKKLIKDAAPDGIDMFFDNIGGEVSSLVLRYMNHNGRVALCGSSSTYNCDAKNLPKATVVQGYIVHKELKLEGFHVHRWKDRWMEGIHSNLNLVREGKLKYRETITDGFENMPKAFINILQLNTFGKAVVKV